jgi:hypothetical protein
MVGQNHQASGPRDRFAAMTVETVERSASATAVLSG